MNELNTSSKFSKRFIFGAAWIILCFLVAIYFAVVFRVVGPLLVISAFAPILILILQKLDVSIRRVLRDNAYLKEKASKASTEAEKSYTEIKIVRSRVRHMSARNTRTLELVKDLKQEVGAAVDKLEERFGADFSQNSLQSRSIATPTNEITDLSVHDELESVVKRLSVLAHFGYTKHPSLSPLHEFEISRILDHYEISNVVLYRIDEISTFDRILKQSVIHFPFEVDAQIPEESQPFVIITGLEGLRSLKVELGDQIATLNASFIIPSPLSDDCLDQLQFAQIPTDLDLQAVEFICPRELLGGKTENNMSESSRPD